MTAVDYDATDLVDDHVFRMAQRGEAQLRAPTRKPAGSSHPQGRRPPRPSQSTQVPRLALNKTDAAKALGVSVDFFDEHIAHELRCVRRGRRRLYAVRDIEAWLDRAGELVDGRRHEAEHQR